jgi:hypothetical protein
MLPLLFKLHIWSSKDVIIIIFFLSIKIINKL